MKFERTILDDLSALNDTTYKKQSNQDALERKYARLKDQHAKLNGISLFNDE
jgi:hypothetical protein